MPGPLLQRLVNKADFERLLSVRSAGRSAHFALHHVADGPSAARLARSGGVTEKLSTEPVTDVFKPVDNALAGLWMGCVVPKRHARRAVTRNLLKRQVRGAFERHAAHLPPGLWLVRLRAGFPKEQFPSARSAALAAVARSELDLLLQKVRP
jgi:ribonuclease P protein component